MGRLNNPGSAENRARVRDFLRRYIGATNRECADALGLSELAVGRHVRAIRAEWPVTLKPPDRAQDDAD